jgi:predicted  nucleic acid-binding Zn-ribbon protein
MGERTFRAERSLQVLQSVRCLACESVYTKPCGGGTAAMNPGCPECGYLGWSPFSVQEASLQRHSVAGHRPRPPA